MTLKAGQVGMVSYVCRDLGYGVEEGSIEGYWTGEVDGWGKRTFEVIDGGEGPIYLFPDEILEVDYPYEGEEVEL